MRIRDSNKPKEATQRRRLLRHAPRWHVRFAVVIEEISSDLRGHETVGTQGHDASGQRSIGRARSSDDKPAD
jgi:hypothetical protein